MNVSSVPAASAINLKDLVFDADFYHNAYPDLQAAFHHDKSKLLKHWNEFGIKEGRACSAVLDLKFYLGAYPDLQAAFGTDYTKAYNHFFQYGVNEKRKTSSHYDPKVYQTVYPFLSGLAPAQLIYHFLKLGQPAGMIATMDFDKMPVPPMNGSAEDLVFDADFYYNAYPDLQKAFGHDESKLRKHWKEYGIKEGRACSACLDLKFYLATYGDLQNAFGSDYTKAYNHFFQYGMKELRASSATYNPKTYQSRYDLKLEPLQLLNHFMSYGRKHCMVAH